MKNEKIAAKTALAMRALREKHGVSVADLCQAIECSKNHYNRYETGQINPSLRTLVMFLSYFGIDLFSLFEQESSVRKNAGVWVKVKNVAEEHNLPSSVVRSAAICNIITSRKFGRCLYVKRDEVALFVEEYQNFFALKNNEK